MDEIQGKTMFLAYCFTIRIVEALGSSAAITAGMSICANVFPDNIAQMSVSKPTSYILRILFFMSSPSHAVCRTFNFEELL